MSTNETPVKVAEISGKPFGFQVQEYRKRFYLVGREMYNPDPDSKSYASLDAAAKSGQLVFGRNGVNIDITSSPAAALDYIGNMILMIMEGCEMDWEEVVTQIEMRFPNA